MHYSKMKDSVNISDAFQRFEKVEELIWLVLFFERSHSFFVIKY